MLDAWLASQRHSFLDRCTGLDGEQLAQRSVPPSPLSLLGLVRHVTDMERAWFRRRFAGQPVAAQYPERDSCFTGVEPERAQRDYETLRAEWRLADEAIAPIPLDTVYLHPRWGEMSLRWLYLHVIREYAGHIGHADLLRERVDGTTFS